MTNIVREIIDGLKIALIIFMIIYALVVILNTLEKGSATNITSQLIQAIIAFLTFMLIVAGLAGSDRFKRFIDDLISRV